MIAIVDYQMGNLRSVQKALEKVGSSVCITSDPDEVQRADKVVLPGVGAFPDAMAELERRELIAPLREFIGSGRPFLGICLGLQLLFDESVEGGVHRGMGVLAGRIERFELPAPYKVPHMGWNEVTVVRRPPIWQGLEAAAYFYFVHSYFALPADPADVSGETDYGGKFCSMVWRDNVFATQFHPEKSQAAGLRLLENFAVL